MSAFVGTPPIDVSRYLTYIVIKPDGIACRKGAAILDFVRSHGLVPIGVRRVRLRHHVIYGIWRYQWNRAAIDRVRLSTVMAGCADSLLVVLADLAQPSPIPLAVRLWELKGSAFARERQSHHLRSCLGINDRFFGYVHLPDEPADVIRELGLLFPGDGLSRLLLDLQPWRDATGRVLEEVQQLEESQEPFVMDDARSLERLLERLRAGSLDATLAERLRSLGAGDCSRGTISLAGIADRSFFQGQPPRLDWDLIVVAAARVLENLPEVEPLIDSGEAVEAAARWLARSLSQQSTARTPGSRGGTTQ